MGVRAAGADWGHWRRSRRRTDQGVLREYELPGFARQRRRSPATPELDAAPVRRIHHAGDDPVRAISLPGSGNWVWTMGASLGAYHAANTLFKHPDAVKRCYALSGVYDMSGFMDGMYDDNFYFNNPAHY